MLTLRFIRVCINFISNDNIKQLKESTDIEILKPNAKGRTFGILILRSDLEDSIKVFY